MAPLHSQEATTLRASIFQFIQDRLDEKLAGIKPDAHAERAKLQEKHTPATWLANAAKLMGQIQLATHILKPIHPDARGTELRVLNTSTELPGLVSSRMLSAPDDDVVGNAAALGAYKLLKLEHEGQSLLQRALDGDPVLLAALSDNREQAEAWLAAFAGIARTSDSSASHTLARQLYFPLDDGGYHLLAPLFPTSLIHRLQRTLRNDRFGDAAKAAREARKDGERWPHGYCEYPDMAIQKFGGTKPQNISQLNSERYGENWLLAALPPQWQSTEVRLPLGVSSVFDRAFGGQRQVRELTGGLREFLQGTERNNAHIRRKRAAMVAAICDELLQYAASLQALEPGWSERDDCLLHPAERRWLDPHHPQEAVPDWQQQVSHRFGNWLNHVLDAGQLRLDEDVHAQWKRDLLGELQLLREVLDDEL